MALIYAGTGTTEIRLIGELIRENPYSANLLVYIGMALMFCGLAFKVSLVPFHSWTPDVYQGAPTPITAFMSVATKAAAFALIARIFYIALPAFQEIWIPFLFGVSVLTMLVGNIAAIFQDNVSVFLPEFHVFLAENWIFNLLRARINPWPHFQKRGNRTVYFLLGF